MKKKTKKRKDNDRLLSPLKDPEFQKQIDIIAKSSIENKLKFYKIALYAFITGLGIFVLSGLLTKGQLFEIVIKNIYTPEHIFTDIEPNISKKVWATVTSGTGDNYKEFVSRDEFYDALSMYHTELVRTFLLPNREPIVRAREIIKVGSISQDVRILMGGKHIEGKTTARCYNVFRNSEKQAIIVIPKLFDRTEYSWFDCSFGWPAISLTLEYQGRLLDNIDLVGVRRNGLTGQLTVLVSRKVAEELTLPGWEEYKSNAYGKVFISKAGELTTNCDTKNTAKKFVNNIRNIVQQVPVKNVEKITVETQHHLSGSKVKHFSDIAKVDVPSVTNYPRNYQLTNANSLYKRKKYKDSYFEFEKILASTQDQEVKIGAQFMMGECNFQQEKYDLAILDYQQIISHYANHPKTRQALLKQALAFKLLNDAETAKIIYKKIVFTYNSTPEAMTAMEQLNILQKK